MRLVLGAVAAGIAQSSRISSRGGGGKPHKNKYALPQHQGQRSPQLEAPEGKRGTGGDLSQQEIGAGHKNSTLLGAATREVNTQTTKTVGRGNIVLGVLRGRAACEGNDNALSHGLMKRKKQLEKSHPKQRPKLNGKLSQ